MFKHLFCAVSCMFLLVACEVEPTQHATLQVFKGPIMGTEYSISVLVDVPSSSASSSQGFATPELESAVIDVMQRTNQIMSHYIGDSDLSNLNRAAASVPVDVNPELAYILRLSQQLSQESNGAFDITLAPVIDAWGFGPAGEISQRPSPVELEALRERVGYKKYTVEENTVTKSVPGLSFNLSAIAKGYAVDAVSDFLREQGFINHLVDIGGELRASGRNKSGDAWQIGIEKPHVLGGLSDVIGISDQAIATSGDYRNFIEFNGQRYSHTIDAISLSPVLHKLASVSVIHTSATMADGLATVVLAMGEVRGIEFARAKKLSFYAMIREQNGQFSTIVSDDLQPLLYHKGD